ncbi:efflux RND transporter periplasmic adaptor subunit [Sporichthya sp.]|uniref:efflux RND transporter periplasmic adaptor subunit n=1 Tax=Sporichthya sp. TaxID=65475 RepID=UPI0017F8F297|nr:efflux RND transporter periplasmic adaptor subunit [Sporichthya sp.]MBA3743630.1 efflux RND transporter periplasmic adaptor subunit [Sporichthya sp.]
MRSWSARGRTGAGVLLAAGLCVTGLSGCGGDDKSVELGTVETRSVAEVVEAAGAVVARTQVSLKAPASASVDTLRVDSGDTVKKGDILLTLDSPAAEDALAAALAAAEEVGDADIDIPTGGEDLADGEAAQAAEDAFDDAEALARTLPEGPARDAALSQTASMRASFAAAQAQAQMAIDRFTAGLGSLAEALSSISAAGRLQTQAAVAAARRTVEALTIRAPANGVITLGTGAGSGVDPSALLGSLPAEASALLGAGAGSSAGSPTGGPITVGAPVEAGGLLATVIDDSELTLRAEVDETDILTVTEGIPAEIELDAVPGGVYPAQVKFVDLAPTTSARGGVSYAVTMALQPGKLADGSDAPRPRPGMSAVVSLQVAEAADAMSVPASALVRDGDRDTVWLVEGGKAVRREVALGAEGQEYVQVLRGLEVGDRVVVRGADEVREGDKV